MTNYGPPGGGDPGPWRGQRPDETPGRPVQQPYPPAVPSYPPAPQGRPGPYEGPGHAPYGGPGAAPYGGGPGAAPYGGGSEGPYGREHGSPQYGGAYGANPAYGGQQYRPDEDPYGGDPAPAPGRRGRGPLIAVLAVVLLVVAAGGAFWLLRGQDDPAPLAAPSESPVAGEPSPDADVAEPAPSGAAPESSADPRFAKVGQCVRNDGAAGGKPKLVISGCVAKSYEVLSRIDGATSGERDAEAKCGKVEGYTNWYFFDSELDTLDFVLCLKQR